MQLPLLATSDPQYLNLSNLSNGAPLSVIFSAIESAGGLRLISIHLALSSLTSRPNCELFSSTLSTPVISSDSPIRSMRVRTKPRLLLILPLTFTQFFSILVSSSKASRIMCSKNTFTTLVYTYSLCKPITFSFSTNAVLSVNV